ncbi:MAG: PASTA domain-containing protein [Oscillospiraceae bacterium]|nr:PASTA domain-containing protein [Oscillospiraceae bacterium]
MRTIICKKCGAEIDAALGECPRCGAVYYILPSEEEKKLEWAMSTDTDIDETQIFANNEANQARGAANHSARDILNADNDELFNTRVWKNIDDPDTTQAINLQGIEKAKPVAAPVHRPATQSPVQPRPTRPEAKAELSRNISSGNVSPQNKEKNLRKKQLGVAAIALLAVLTLVLSIMGGLFDFSGSGDDSSKMQDVVGFTQETATTILTALGLDVKTELQEDEAVVGTVIKQSIKEGKKIKEGDTVTLVISSGQSAQPTTAAEYVDVPTLTGKTYDEARQVLDKLGLGITKAEDSFSDEEVGKIISQLPMKGAKLQKGDLVTVTVSKGPETTEYEITVTAGKGGAISPKGAVTVEDGEDQSFTITADEGYEIFEVKVDGTSIGAVATYTFTKVSEDHTIYVVFKQKAANASPSPSVTPTPSPSPTKPASGTDITA